MNQSQRAIWTWKPSAARAAGRLDAGEAGEAMRVTSDGRDLDHEHDRVADQRRGSSLRTRCGRAARSSSRVEDAARSRAARRRRLAAAERARSAGSGACHATGRRNEGAPWLEDLPRVLEELLDDGPQRQGREVGQGADDDRPRR